MKPFYVIQLPLPPGVNASYKIVTLGPKTGKRFNRLGATKELLQFKKNAAKKVPEGIHDWPMILNLRTAQAAKIMIPMSIQIHFYYSTLWRKDIDGGIKATQDAIFKYLELNDNRVTDMRVKKRRIRPGEEPRVEVWLSLDEEEEQEELVEEEDDEFSELEAV